MDNLITSTLFINQFKNLFMKKILFVTTMLVLIILFFTGCKKNQETDYSSLFKNTVWTGAFNYDNAAAEPYSLQFNENGNFTWREFLGIFSGNWKIEGKQIILSFINGHSFKADISNDQMLNNIQNNVSNGWSVTSGQLNAATEQVLDGTVWKAANNNPAKLIFSSGLRVDATGSIFSVFGSLGINVNYTREAGAVLFSTSLYNFFSIIVPDGKSMIVLNKSLNPGGLKLFRQ